jgi:hypothetical protein
LTVITWSEQAASSREARQHPARMAIAKAIRARLFGKQAIVEDLFIEALT